jgi:hypothetical protein
MLSIGIVITELRQYECRLTPLQAIVRVPMYAISERYYLHTGHIFGHKKLNKVPMPFIPNQIDTNMRIETDDVSPDGD